MGLGRNKWHFLSFVGTRLSASRAPSGPHTTPLAPTIAFTSANEQAHMNIELNYLY